MMTEYATSVTVDRDSRTSVLEEQLPILRHRPEAVVDEGLQLIGDLTQRELRGDHLVHEGGRLILDGLRLVGGVLRMLEIGDPVDEGIGQPGDLLADRVDPA